MRTRWSPPTTHPHARLSSRNKCCWTRTLVNRTPPGTMIFWNGVLVCPYGSTRTNLWSFFIDIRFVSSSLYFWTCYNSKIKRLRTISFIRFGSFESKLVNCFNLNARSFVLSARLDLVKQLKSHNGVSSTFARTRPLARAKVLPVRNRVESPPCPLPSVSPMKWIVS